MYLEKICVFLFLNWQPKNSTFANLFSRSSYFIPFPRQHQQEAYRQWVCSTFIPYFATRSEVKSDPKPVNDTEDAISNTNLLENVDNKAQELFKQTHNLERSNELKR